MSLPKQTAEHPVDPQQPVGGAIIDGEGHEIAITEEMVQKACSELEKDSLAPPPEQHD
ncbi:PA1571 family protein [Pseudomonas zhanjiangensis]|uniref:PA1571 family protein n=1 Tax=Pseudomonas zhanjiangensis TaxID=3239015 RepID=A0ABV3YXV8_9PSED